MNNLLFDFSSGVQSRTLIGGLVDEVPQLKVVTSKFYGFFGSNSHTIYVIETLIIENKNYEHNSNPQIVRQYELLSFSV